MIDPTVTPRTECEQMTLDRSSRYGLTAARIRPGTEAVHVTGRGLHLLAASLAAITRDDIEQMFEPVLRP